MRPSLGFEFNDGGMVRLPQDIQTKLDNLNDLHTSELGRKIAKYIQTSIERRLVLQRDSNGRSFLRRKHLKWNGKTRKSSMLQGMKHTHITLENGKISVGYKGGRAALAKWHNEGKSGSDGKQRPRRQWLNLSKADTKAINKLITSHLSST